MKALVINTDSANERMDFQKKQLKHLGIEFTRISACELGSINSPIYQKFYKTWERPLKLTEVSCFFSHKKAWSLVLERNEPMLILEDDVLLSKNVPHILKKLIKMKDIDHITLENRSRKKIVSKKIVKTLSNEISLVRLYQDRTGAAGYILWPNGAKKLLDKYNKGVIAIADAFISSAYNLNSFQIEPAMIIQFDQCELYDVYPPIRTWSSVSSRKRMKLGFKELFTFKTRRLLGQYRLAMRRLRNWHVSIKRNIAIVPNEFERKED